MDDITLAKVNTYRQHNKRCRTCRFAHASTYYWSCEAKQQLFHSKLQETHFRGMFCNLYEARKYGERVF